MISVYRRARARVRVIRLRWHAAVGVEEGTRAAVWSHRLDTALLWEVMFVLPVGLALGFIAFLARV